MKLHANARLSVRGRQLLVDRIESAGWSLAATAEAAGVSDRTAAKWRAQGPAGLADRSSAPGRVHGRTDEQRVALIASLRRLRMTGAEIAESLAMPLSTVSGILMRIGMGKLSRCSAMPSRRDCGRRPSQLADDGFGPRRRRRVPHRRRDRCQR